MQASQWRITAIFVGDESVVVDNYEAAVGASMYNHTCVHDDDVVGILLKYPKLAFKAPVSAEYGCAPGKHDDDELWLCWDLVWYSPLFSSSADPPHFSLLLLYTC